MAVDLKSYSSFHRYSLLIMSDALIKLEHQRTQDRIRRYSYDTIQNVIIWRKTPWPHIIICGVLLVLPGIGILFMNSVTSTVIGCFLIAIGSLILANYAYCGMTTIRVIRAGTTSDSKGLFRPGKIRRFREKLVPAIIAAQADIAASAELSVDETTPAS